MIVGAAGNEAQAALDQALAQGGGVFDDGMGVLGERRLRRLAKGDGLGGDDVHERTALPSGEHGLVVLVVNLLVVRDHEAATRATQGLVRGRGNDVGMRYRRRMSAASDKAGDVRHVDHEIGTHLVGDIGKGLEVDDTRIGRGARDDEIGLDLLGNGTDLVHVDALGLGIQTIGMGIVEPTRKRELGTVRKMAASRKRHAQNDGTRIEERKIGCRVSADTRMRLHVGVPGPKHLAGTIARDRLDGVDVGATTVITLAGITFGVLVG